MPAGGWDPAPPKHTWLPITPLARQKARFPFFPCFNASKPKKVRIPLLTLGLQLKAASGRWAARVGVARGGFTHQ